MSLSLRQALAKAGAGLDDEIATALDRHETALLRRGAAPDEIARAIEVYEAELHGWRAGAMANIERKIRAWLSQPENETRH